MAKRHIIVYPLLGALFPVLSYWASNYSQAGAASFYPLLFLAALFALAFFLLSLAVTWNPYRAAFLALLGELAFFSYGHIDTLLAGKSLLGISLGHDRTLIILSVVLVGGIFFLCRKAMMTWEFQRTLNVLGLILVALPAANLAYRVYLEAQSTRASGPAITTTGSSQKPDIYYIILDGYTRGDVLQDVYGFDDHLFYRTLNEMGFVTPACAQGNYGYTHFSMASTLNMAYLEELSPRLRQLSDEYDFADSDYLEFKPYIKRSAVVDFLESQGYKTITFQTGFEWLDITASDQFVRRPESISLIGDFIPTTFLTYTQGINLAERLTGMDEASLLRSVAGVFFRSEKESKSIERQKYDMVNNSLAELEEIIEQPGPKFIYLHLLAPHYPYVMSPEGRYNLEHNEITGYTNQVQFVNRRMTEILTKLFEHYGDKPVVVVLQGDHGWKAPGERRSSSLDRTRILNAYYLPGAGDKVYPEITPVNTFRLIFDTYLGTDLGLLKDKRYLWGKPVPAGCTAWMEP